MDNIEELEVIKSLSGKFNKQWKKEVVGNKKINTLVLDIDGVFASNIKRQTLMKEIIQLKIQMRYQILNQVVMFF